MALLLFACDDEYKREAGGAVAAVAPELNLLPQTGYLLSSVEEDEGYFLFRINWNRARFSYDSGLPYEADGLLYTLEMDRLGNSFADPKPLLVTETLYADVYSEQMNRWVHDLVNCDAVILRYIELRVRTTYRVNDADAEPVYSNVIPLAILPYAYANPEADIVIRWKYTGTEWTEFAIYAYDGSEGETFGGWPGQEVVPDAEGWCSVTVPAGQTVGNVIFNNNNKGKQVDITIPVTSSIDFEISSDSFTVIDCQQDEK
jgi:hypothetical protein